MQLTLGLDLSTLKPHQRQAFVALVQSFDEPYVIPVSDESAEHEAPAIAPGGHTPGVYCEICQTTYR